MPQFMAVYHNEFIMNIIHRGYSKLVKRSHISFAKDGNGFIFPVNLFID